jgi:heat shock protein HslJ
MSMKNSAIIFMSCVFAGISMASDLTIKAGVPMESDSVDSSRSTVPATAPQPGLESMDWQLTRYRDASGQWQPVLSDAAVTARFRDGKLSGSAGCNRYFGSYTLGIDEQLGFSSPLGVTMMACVAPVSEQERQYLNQLSVVVAAQPEDGLLRLLDKNDQVVLEYTAVMPLTLEATHWQATAINNGRGGVVSTVTTGLATAEFNDGRVSGHGGCNTFNASYEITGERITIGPAMTTRRHCAEPAGIMDQEQEYLQALSRAHVYRLADSRLELRDAGGSLQLNFVAVDAEPR